MTDVAAADPANAPDPDSAAPAPPSTPPTNPTNSSEPASPNHKYTSEQTPAPTPTPASTVPGSSANPTTESSDLNQTAPSSEVPDQPAATDHPAVPKHPAVHSPVDVPTSAAIVATPPSIPASDLYGDAANPAASKPTPTSAQQLSVIDPSATQPTEGESPQKTQISPEITVKSDPSPPVTATISDSNVSAQNHPNANSDKPTQNDAPRKASDSHPPPKTASTASRLQAKRLPKVAKHRPDNSRVFIGNLASEYTSSEEILEIFQKYGTLIEEPVLRRSFGFVQYSTAAAAAKAAKQEQGRAIGGIGIDLSIADNREVKRGTHVQNNTPFQHARQQQQQQQQQRGRVRERDNAGAVPDPRKKRRSVSPTSAARKGGVHPPQYRRYRPEPKNGIYLRILCMSPTAKGYAKHCENTFRSMTGLNADILHILAAGLGEALGRAMRDTIPYVMVVASKDVDDGTCTIRTLEKTGYEKSGRGTGIIPLREAVEVCLIERGVIAPTNLAHQAGPPGPPNRPPPPGAASMNARGPPPSGGAQWLNQPHQMAPHMESAKPGWMTGPRPPHPANQAAVRPGPNMPPAAIGAGGASQPGYAHEHGRPPYGHGGPPPPPPQVGRPDSFGRAGGPYDAPSGVGPAPVVIQDYGRSGQSGQYQPQMNTAGGFSDRYGNQQVGRSGNYGPPNGRDSEYDPASVLPSQRPAQSGGYPAWNRDPGQGGRDMYNAGMQGPSREQPAPYPQSSQPYPNQTYGGNQSYSDRQGHMHASDRTIQPGHYGNPQAQSYDGRGGQRRFEPYDSGVPYRRDNPMNQQDGRYSNDTFNGPGGAYQSGGYPQRENRGGWDHHQGAPTGPDGSMHGMPGSGPARYGNQSAPQQHTRGYGSDYHNVQNPYDGSRPDDAPPSQYSVGRGNTGEVRDPRNNQRYDSGRSGGAIPTQHYPGPVNSGSNVDSQAPTHAAVSGAGTVDIGKLTNLISAFQQKQQQSSQQARSQQQQPQQHQDQSHHPQNPGAGRALHGDRQGMSQFLQMPGVQQALQNIGGARLGGYQDTYQQGMNQQNVGMGQNRGRVPEQAGQPHQAYYR